MIILGIDPGTATTGYGILEVDGVDMNALEFGLIETSKDGTPEKRLEIIHTQMLFLFDKFKPDIMAIEKVFFAANARTAIRVGQAQGVMLLSAASMNVPVVEYAPGTIKKLISGDGRADKKMMQQALRKVFGAKVRSKAYKKTHFDNAADALAVALCHVYYCNNGN
jgi:crossover junction endodeoxyribonuclease RuvC